MLSTEIRKKIAQYLDSEISLREFQEWFGPATWDVHQKDPEAVKLTGMVGLWFAELSAGHLTVDEMKYEMRKFLNEPVSLLKAAAIAQEITWEWAKSTAPTFQFAAKPAAEEHA